jgi:plastocyanin
MPKNKPLVVLSSVILGGVGVILAMIMFVGPLFEKDKAAATTCAHTGAPHSANIQNNKILPEHTYAKKCDTLTITNKDTVSRLMAFGQHENHIVYDGISEQGLAAGQSFTVTLDQTGTYLFHDHHDDAVSAEFTVTD